MRLLLNEAKNGTQGREGETEESFGYDRLALYCFVFLNDKEEAPFTYILHCCLMSFSQLLHDKHDSTMMDVGGNRGKKGLWSESESRWARLHIPLSLFCFFLFMQVTGALAFPHSDERAEKQKGKNKINHPQGRGKENGPCMGGIGPGCCLASGSFPLRGA